MIGLEAEATQNNDRKRESQPRLDSRSSTRKNHHEHRTKVLSIAVIAGVGAWSPALAQSLPGSTMLTPGVYTTPEISAKCQAYAAQQVPVGGDQQRQSVALACVKQTYDEEVAKQKK